MKTIRFILGSIAFTTFLIAGFLFSLNDLTAIGFKVVCWCMSISLISCAGCYALKRWQKEEC